MSNYEKYIHELLDLVRKWQDKEITYLKMMERVNEIEKEVGYDS